MLVGGTSNTSVADITVPLGGVLNPAVFVPPKLLQTWQSFIDYFLNAFQLGSTDARAGNADHPENSAGISTEAPHPGNLALLGNFIATSFAATSRGHGGTLAPQAPQVEPQMILTHPHR